VRSEGRIRRAIELMKPGESECSDVGDIETAQMLLQSRMVLLWVLSEKSMFEDLINSLEREQSNG